jgi:rhodanese-related sulfurtransferase
MDPNWLIFILAGVVIGWIVVRTRLGKVAPERARELVKSGALLLDVRTPGEFASGHIEGAKNVPLQDLAISLERIKKDARAVVVYCASGMRSASATRMLRKAGIDAHDLGAMSRW